MSLKNKLSEVIDLINKAYEYSEKETIQGKKLSNADKEFNSLVLSSRIVVHKLGRFNTDYGKYQLKWANRIFSAGQFAIADTDNAVLSDAKNLPQSTEEEKQMRKYAITAAKQLISAKKIIRKHYPNGLVKYDDSILSNLFLQENEPIAKRFLYCLPPKFKVGVL